MSVQILSIDVSSELETLCEAQLRGTWQVPAELVRLALRLGAAEVVLRRRGRGFVISWNGPFIDSEVLVDLRLALDTECDSEDRQRAITAIEDSKMEGLLWAAGLRGARIRIRVADGGGRWSFEHHHRRPRLVRSPRSDRPDTVEIRWWCPGLDRRRAVRWLAIAARFAPARVLVDGTPGPRDFSGGLFHVRIEDPLPCRLGLTRAGDDPVLWLLRDGVVSARATVPGYPPFEAAVELRGLVAPGASAADMRRAVTPFLGELVDRAVWMMVEVSERFSEMSTNDGERLCLLLLRAARKGLRTREICRIGLVRNAADEHRLSVEEIRELADRAGGVLSAVDHGEHVGGGLVDPASTLLASSEVRDLLTELAGVRFQSPSRRLRGFPRRVADRLRAIADHLRRRIRGVLARRDVPPGVLRPQENVVLETVQEAMSPIRVRLCEGRGAAGKTAHGVVVPRFSPAMMAGIDLVAADTAWLYPLLLALDTGQEPPEDLRDRWLENAGSVAGKK